MDELEGDFADAIFHDLASKAEPILQEKLSKAGVRNVDELKRTVANRFFCDSLLEACERHFPDADLKMMRRVVEAMTDDDFRHSFTELRRTRADPLDAFAFAQGEDAAVVLAALGVPVRPIHTQTLQVLGGWARNAAAAASVFGRYQDSFVGYDPATVPFYVAVTDCVDTLARRVRVDPQLAMLQALMLRRGGALPEPKGVAFQHGCVLLPRLQGEMPETVVLMDSNPRAGSIMFLAGWRDGSGRHGTPDGRLMPVPMRLLNSLVTDPETLVWLNRPPQ